MSRTGTITTLLRHALMAEEYPQGLLKPNILLPAQFFSFSREATRGGVERALMCAVLEDAVYCFQKYFAGTRRSHPRLARETEWWFWANDYHWPFSFVNICAVLDLDPETIREALQRWRRTAQRPRYRSPRCASVFRNRTPLAI
ncbi:MAG TPA: hypothetical protein VNN62_00475 [Methylomirabilota bacterium]|nr:hypothetical protein [Methylomirabilota bacterium]